MTIDWIPQALKDVPALPAVVAELPGSLGLSAAPGRWSGDVEGDLRAIHAAGTTLLVSLLPDADLARNGLLGPDGSFLERAAAIGLRVLRYPVRDFGIPSTVDATLDVVLEILRHLSAGERVVVHCGAGLGRTGMIAACCLVELGVPAVEAIRLVRTARRGSVETRAQEDFVRRFESDRP